MNILTAVESKRSLELAVTTWEARKKLAPKFDKGKYVLAVYERIKRVTIPLDDNHDIASFI